MNDGKFTPIAPQPMYEIRCRPSRHQSLAQGAMEMLIRADYTAPCGVDPMKQETVEHRKIIIEHALAFADDMLAAEDRRAEEVRNSPEHQTIEH